MLSVESPCYTTMTFAGGMLYTPTSISGIRLIKTAVLVPSD